MQASIQCISTPNDRVAPFIKRAAKIYKSQSQSDKMSEKGKSP